MSKQLYIKSYTSANEYITTFTDFRLSSFTKQINVGLGSMQLTLPRKLDSFNSEGDVSLGNKLELWIADEDTGSTPVIVYAGYIEQQRPKIIGSQEYVDIICLSVASRFVQDVLKSSATTLLYTAATGGLTTSSGSLAASEIADVVSKIVDLFTTNNPEHNIQYNLTGESTIEDTSLTIQYTFQGVTYAEAIRKCKDAAPQNWYWYIDENHIFSFKSVPSTATHTFTIGKDIESIDVTKGLDSVKNIILISNETLYSQFKDDQSISLYGRRTSLLNDANLTDQTTINNVGKAFIEENKDPRIRIVMRIIDNNESNKGYNIESINPGDTCKIVGISPEQDIFTDNMIINEVLWTPTGAELIIETRSDFDLNNYILSLQKSIQEQSVSNLPATYS